MTDKDEICGKYHAVVFQLGDAAKEAGDDTSLAVARYLHDQFCLTRAALRGEERASADLAPYPVFRTDARNNFVRVLRQMVEAFHGQGYNAASSSALIQAQAVLKKLQAQEMV